MPNTPKVLWKLFHKKARTLGDTIVSVIPPAADGCRCRLRRPCIRCRGPDVMSFLLRPNDPSDYRSLLTNCFVVLNTAAPRLPDFVPHSNWSQPQIVAHTIEKIKHDHPNVPNVISHGYDKYSQSSTVLELLTTSAWSTLLTRVGETVMVYLLMHTSIFLPHPKKKHLQVTGAPIPALCKFKYFKYKSMVKQGHPSPKSRKRSGACSVQRSTKRRRVDLQEMSSTAHLPSVSTNEESGRCQTHLYADSICQYRKVPQDGCMQFLTFQVVNKHAQIDRKFMFFNLDQPALVFPKKHVLISSKFDSGALDSLLRTIFGLSAVNASDESAPCSYSGDFCPIGSTCLYHALAKMLKMLIRRTKRCQHRNLLDRHCPIPDSTCMFKGSKSGPHVSDAKHHKSSHAIDPMHEAIKSYSSKSQVVSFIWAVCRNIIPPDLLGNMRILRRNIFKFIRLRRFEIFYFKQCMHKLDVSRFLNRHELKYWTEQGVVMLGGCMKHKIIESWILWLFSSLVVPLVQAHFYVTESQHGKRDVYYYRKSVWKKMANEAFNQFKVQNSVKLNDEDVKNILLRRKFGFSKVRLLPKENELRMLANLKASSKVPKSPKRVPSVNNALCGIHVILKSLKLKNPEKLGSSVFDYKDVYRHLRPFVLGLKNGLANLPDVFIVSCDVSKAFDSIKQDKLLTVMKEFILEGEYRLKQSTQVICTKKCQWVRKNTGLARFASSAFSGNSSHSIVVDDDKEIKMTKEDMLSALEEHVKQNILLLGRQFYLQGVGISQGSILSSMLCSLYYGHLERNVIYPFLENACYSASEDKRTSFPTYMLLRLIDDFLFISTSKEQASRFFSRMREGFCDYNCYMNEGKFSLNFEDGLSSNRLYVCEDGTSFLSWSGLFINCRTLEVQADYTRYLKNHLLSTLTVGWGDEPNFRLIKKILNFLQPKCHPIFFDSNINSAATTRLNIYQAFLLSAMKFSCYTRAFLCICKLDTNFYLKVIEKSLRHMCKLIKKMKSVPLGPNLLPDVQLEDAEVEWLGLNAYSKVLNRKQSRHKELLSLLRLKLLAHIITGSLSSPLTYAIDDSRSSIMWKIKY